jgi:DNA-binding NtrC family response regulator
MLQQTPVNVLLVEDEYINAWALANALKLHCNIRHAATKEEALYWIQRETFQFVLLDINLGQNREAGIEILPEIKRIQPDCRVFATTGYGTETDEARFLGMGFHAYHTKPVDENRIVFEIQNYTAHRNVA